MGLLLRAALSGLALAGCGQVSLGSTLGPGGDGGDAAAGVGGSSGGGGAAGAIGGEALDGGVESAAPDAASRSVDGAPSCSALSTCGSDGASCCEARLVPAGAYDFGVRDPSASASLASTSAFLLDSFEVTLGRYRAFAADYDRWRAEGHPAAGEGAHPLIEGSGWRESWAELLPVSSAVLAQDAIVCQGQAYSTFSAAASEAVPVNCVSWYEAFAFCAWDGGRLPTQAEWEHAATGGSEQRLYPWGSAPAPSEERAVFGCVLVGDEQAATCTSPGPLAVGSRPLGVGRFGQQDLAGSLSEWVLDAFGTYPASCDDCALVEDAIGFGLRYFRGGSWSDEAPALALGERLAAPASVLSPSWGFRCARDGG